MLRPFFTFVLILLALPLAAQDADKAVLFGNDAYLAGQNARHSGEGIDDLFAVGDRVESDAALTGTAHLFGRNVSLRAPVQGSLYALGQDIDVTAPVQGDVQAFGQNIRIEAEVGGDLRAIGQNVEVSAPVGDSLAVGGESATLNGAVTGDVSLSANRVFFGENAAIGGTLNLYHDDPASIDIPASVIPADRIVLHTAAQWDEAQPGMGDVVGHSWWDIAKRKIAAVAAVTLAAIAVAWLAPDFLAGLRDRALERPVRAVWIGFLGLSAAIGSVVLFALTGIGLIVAPLSILIAVVLGFVGYVAGAYVLGVALSGAFARPLPETLGEKALAALIGAVAAGLIALVPFLGWLFVLGLSLMGVGALVSRWFRPAFFASA